MSEAATIDAELLQAAEVIGADTAPQNKGQVRIRSNVCLESDAWHLVPGDVLRRYNLHYGRVTAKQHDEMMYYEPCSICRRMFYQIMDDGCDHPVCRKQEKIPSTADAALRKSRYLDTV